MGKEAVNLNMPVYRMVRVHAVAIKISRQSDNKGGQYVYSVFADNEVRVESALVFTWVQATLVEVAPCLLRRSLEPRGTVRKNFQLAEGNPYEG